MEWILGFTAIIVLVIGLVGQAFEMRRIRLVDGPAPVNVFTDKRNFKWYALIGASIILWYAAEQI